MQETPSTLLHHRISVRSPASPLRCGKVRESTGMESSTADVVATAPVALMEDGVSRMWNSSRGFLRATWHLLTLTAGTTAVALVYAAIHSDDDVVGDIWRRWLNTMRRITSNSSASKSIDIDGSLIDGDVAQSFDSDASPLVAKNASFQRIRDLGKRQGHTVEICVCDIESVAEAIAGGASSLYLCADRASGGVTPSYGLMQESCRIRQAEGAKDVEIHVLVRPRGGDFVYSHAEFELLKQDVAAAHRAGVDGIICGVLTEDGSIDVPRLSLLRSLAPDLVFTFARAFDLCVDPFAGIETLVELRVDRVLTSGGEKLAKLAVNGRLPAIVEAAAGRIEVLATGRIDMSSVETVLATGVDGVLIGGSVSNVELSRMVVDGAVQSSIHSLSTEMMVWRMCRASAVREIAEKVWKYFS